MLENCKTAQERWGGTHDMIDRWLNDRQSTLIKFFDVQGSQNTDAVSGALTSFCEDLVDYISKGHFEIYEQLFREAKEFDDGGIELANKVYPKLEATTAQLLAFNDRYQSEDDVTANRDSLKGDLSSLGENMAERFELEDQLIESLHIAHKEKVVA